MGEKSLLYKKYNWKLWFDVFFLIFVVIFHLFWTSSALEEECLMMQESSFAFEIHDRGFFEGSDCGKEGIVVATYLWNHLPVYFILMKFAFLVFGPSVLTALWFAIIMSSTVIAGMYLLLRRFFSISLSVVVTLMYLFSFAHFHYSREFQEYYFFSGMFFLMLYFLYCFIQSKHRVFTSYYHYPYCISLFLLGMTHNYFLFVFLFLLLYLIALWFFSPVLSQKRFYYRLSVHTFAFGLVPFMLIFKNLFTYVDNGYFSINIFKNVMLFFKNIFEIYQYLFKMNFTQYSQYIFIFSIALMVIIFIGVLYYVYFSIRHLVGWKKKNAKKYLFQHMVFYMPLFVALCSICFFSFMLSAEIAYAYAFFYPLFYLCFGYACYIVYEKFKNNNIICILFSMVLILLLMFSLFLGNTIRENNDYEFSMICNTNFYKMIEGGTDIDYNDVDYFSNSENVWFEMYDSMIWIQRASDRFDYDFDGCHYNISSSIDFEELGDRPFIVFNWEWMGPMDEELSYIEQRYPLIYKHDFGAYTGYYFNVSPEGNRE